MTRQLDGADLRDVRADAESLVRAFLEVRPSGGRVWVDDAGDAVTSRDGTIVYLGNIRELRPGHPVVGQPVPGFTGRRYDVRPSGITDRATGDSLSECRRAAVVERLIAELLRVRPGGGTYRVAENGDAATWVDGGWVFAGRVPLGDWFPDRPSSRLAV